MFRNRKKRPDVIQTARGQRIFAIGDIHGRYDLLEQILDEVLSRFKSPHHFGKANRLIFLGTQASDTRKIHKNARRCANNLTQRGLLICARRSEAWRAFGQPGKLRFIFYS